MPRRSQRIKAQTPPPDTKRATTRPLTPVSAPLTSTSESKPVNIKRHRVMFQPGVITKLCSWNVNGLRAAVKKGVLDTFKGLDANILCLQETKIPNDVARKIEMPFKYAFYNESTAKKGYAGTAILCDTEPLSVTYDLPKGEHPAEGRIITAEFDRFFLINSYTPNSGQGLKRLEYRQSSWDPDFKQYVMDLQDQKPVVVCGDLNVAHHEIDLHSPQTNTKSAGFTPQERESFTQLLEEGQLTDSFRHLYPDRKAAYSFWSARARARPRNVGWRLDYFLLSGEMMECLHDASIDADVEGSDHCPISVYLRL